MLRCLTRTALRQAQGVRLSQRAFTTTAVRLADCSDLSTGDRERFYPKLGTCLSVTFCIVNIIFFIIIITTYVLNVIKYLQQNMLQSYINVTS